MHLSLLLAFPLLCHAQASSPAQNSTSIASLSSFLQSLSATGENAFVNATERVVGTNGGAQFLAELANAITGNDSLTILVPDNDAFTGSPPSNITNLDLLSDIFTYHLLKGGFTVDNIALFPSYTLVRTFMNASQLVQLEGNESQVLAITNDNGTIKVIGQNTPVQVVSPITLPSNVTNPNLKAYVLSAVLDPPPLLPDALSSTNLSLFQAAAQQTSYLASLESTHGVTIFAPSNQAANLLSQTNSSILSNLSSVTALLQNHVINGTTLYSTQFPLNATSASGESLAIATNSSGIFVSSGNNTAKIVQPNILISNGVIHVIDGVLLNTATNATAASSAVASASSAAATAASAQATQTSPVGNSSNSGVSTNSTSNGNNNGNGKNGALSVNVSFGHVISIFLFIYAGCAITL